MCPLSCDHRVADDWEYSASEDVVDATDVIAEVAHLEATFALELYLMRAPLSKTCYQVYASKEMID
jgi:hypothetical protein